MTEKKMDRNLERAPDVAGADQVQEAVDAENAQGFRGYNPDPTPNEHYTFAGQAAGKPTPETDPAFAAKAGRPFLTHAGDGLPHPLEKADAKDEK